MFYYYFILFLTHSGPENLKKSRPKNSWKQINQFHKKIFFAIFELGESLKLPKIQFHVKKFDWFDLTSFFASAFLNFLARCAKPGFKASRTRTFFIFLPNFWHIWWYLKVERNESIGKIWKIIKYANELAKNDFKKALLNLS